jgi:hypothetical protein
MPTHQRYTAEHIAVRDTLIFEAVKAGKILASRTQYYQQLYDADPQNTRVVLANLAPVLGKQTTSGGTSTRDDYEPSWLTARERARVANARSGGQRPVIEQTND